ncbi:MAG TPA: hypothetical protein VEA99_16040 [Gemmatimonadaceae bacterium]|nr:hypothetical protein [Gemmatimonadaceae bacterium]
MSAKKLDGAGTAKLKTLEEGLNQLQTIHGKVETYALEVKKNGSPAVILMQIRRLLPLLAGLLKPQFGILADQVIAFNLAASRGGGVDTQRVRILREGVATLRQAMEITAKRVEEHHAVVAEEAKPEG